MMCRYRAEDEDCRTTMTETTIKVRPRASYDIFCKGCRDGRFGLFIGRRFGVASVIYRHSALKSKVKRSVTDSWGCKEKQHEKPTERG